MSWDLLYVDNHLNSLRQKFTLKFTPKVKLVINSNNADKNKIVSVSIEKLPSSILTKSPKEVKEISKYFKNLKVALVSKSLTKSYTQASKPVNYTEEVIRIKDTFPSLRASKIDQVQKIIKGGEKLKPHIKMTTKGPSRKQVIISMNGDNIIRFIKESSLHISNLNKALKNIKSHVLVDFICLDLLGITVVTTKVTLISNLQVIKNYIKSINCIDATGVEVPHLSQSKSYLIIIDIPYYQEDSTSSITSKVIKDIVKQNQIFDNIMLASKPHVIKISSRSDMAIV